jgi:hypothetical protein
MGAREKGGASGARGSVVKPAWNTARFMVFPDTYILYSLTYPTPQVSVENVCDFIVCMYVNVNVMLLRASINCEKNTQLLAKKIGTKFRTQSVKARSVVFKLKLT